MILCKQNKEALDADEIMNVCIYLNKILKWGKIR